MTRSAGHGGLQSIAQSQFRGSGLQGGEGRFWSHITEVKGLLLCPVHAQHCQHSHKTHLGSKDSSPGVAV